MLLDCYPVISDDTHTLFGFISEGPNDKIKKGIYFELVKGNVFNLLFEDWDESKQKVDDNARSNNMNSKKVLATITLQHLIAPISKRELRDYEKSCEKYA